MSLFQPGIRSLDCKNYSGDLPIYGNSIHYCRCHFLPHLRGHHFYPAAGVNVDKPSAAFTGAVAMVLFGVLSSTEAVAAIDFNTIFLLLGMMIIVAGLQMDGAF